MAAPMDLNVPLCEKHVLIDKLKMAQKLGYEVVAINNVMPNLFDKRKKKDKKVEVLAPEKVKITDVEDLQKLGVSCQPLRQLSRISMVLTDTAQTHVMEHANIQAYDLIAVQPTSEKTFQQACMTLNIDIITVDVTEKLGFHVKRTSVNRAIERGIHFELQYSHAIRDQTLRRYLITNAQDLLFGSKGKNLILTSGCEKAFEMRGPHDVSNLALLFGLTEAQAKDAVTRKCRAVLLHSEARHLAKCVLNVEKVSSVTPKDSWLLESCDAHKSCANGQIVERVNQSDNGHSDNGQSDSVEKEDGEPVSKKAKKAVIDKT